MNNCNNEPYNTGSGIPPVRPFRFWCQKVLPLVYEDSLSYYETLCKVVAKLNEVINTLNDYSDNLEAMVDQKIKDAIQEFTNLLTEYENEINTRVDTIETKVNGIEDKVDEKIAESQSWVIQQINNLTKDISLKIAEIYVKINKTSELDRLYTDFKIEELIRNLPIFDEVIVVCPVNGKIMPLSECLGLMYDTLRIFGLTALEYDLLELTANEYDDHYLTCLQYDLFAKFIFRGYDNIHRVFSAYSGKKVSIQQAIYELQQEQRYLANNCYLLDKGVILAETPATNESLILQQSQGNNYAGFIGYIDEVDNPMTAADYDRLNLTAWQFDWWNSVNNYPANKETPLPLPTN